MADKDQWTKVVQRVPARPLAVVAEAEIKRAAATILGLPVNSSGIELEFGAPEHGWLNFLLSSSGQRVEWWLSEAFDPFRADERESGKSEHTFVPWLERMAVGENPALAIEMEGPWGVALVTPMNAPTIRVSFTAAEKLFVDAAVDRLIFVRDFYQQLVAFWESDAFASQWKQWSTRSPSWSIRSAIIEKAIK